MKKFLIFYLLLFNSLLFGCATCQLMIPTAELNVDVKIENKTVKNIHMQWNFSDLYSDSILIQYDKNKNGILDEKELKIVLDAMLTYLVKKDMLTKVEYITEDDNSTIIKPSYKNFKIKMVDELLIFTYNSFMDIDIADKSKLSFVFQDTEEYFGFVVSDLKVSDTKLYHKQLVYLFVASVSFSDTPFKKKIQQKKEVVLTNDLNTSKQEDTEELKYIKKSKDIREFEDKTSLQTNILKESIIKIKSLFESIKDEKNPLTYMFLLFFAYIYGVIHALGPGHGKTLVASYFLSNDRSYSKALYISIAIGFVHTFSAFLLTLVIYFVVNTFLAQFLDDTVFYTTKISAIIIIAIAVYLIYKKYKAYKEIEQLSKAPKYSFSTTPHISTCGCNSCKVDNNSTDVALIISAGIIPCPGTTTIFIFAISLGLFYAGFVSALVMSMGMSTIIFFSALLSVAVRKKTSDTNTNLKKYLEYGSLAVILILGLILLFT